MPEDIAKTVCHTPTPGKQPTAIPSWKYELLRKHILAVVPSGKPGIAAKDLADLVRDRLESNDLDQLGSVSWHTTTVRLNMEVEGELTRLANSTPLRLYR